MLAPLEPALIRQVINAPAYFNTQLNTTVKGLTVLDSAQCYKPFYGRNLRIFVVDRVFVPGKLFLQCLMLVGKDRNLP